MTLFLLGVIAAIAGGFLYLRGQEEDDRTTIRYGKILLFLGFAGFLPYLAATLTNLLLALVLG